MRGCCPLLHFSYLCWNSSIDVFCVARCSTHWKLGFDYINFTVVVAVVAVWMMQMAIHQIVYMIAMRDRFVATIGPVYMLRIMPAVKCRCTFIWICICNCDRMLHHCTVILLVVQVTIV